jgi:DNA polymerase III epsilon subunit-like protein
MWLDHLPASVVFCDVETTGLGHHDRIVSFGGIGMISRDLAKGRLGPAYLYLVFNPGTENHRVAERIHAFSDSVLRLQDRFAVHAVEVWRFLTSYELLVAHNAAFDLRFINREMRLSGLPALTRPARAHQACLLHHERIPRARARRQRFSECGLPPHQARPCWRSARRDRGRLARYADLLLAARLPASGSIARLASSHSIQLPSR